MSMSKGQKKKVYSAEFKVEAVKMVLEQGEQLTSVADNLGIGSSMLCKWIKKYQKANAILTEAFPSKGHLSPSDEKVRQLEADLKRVTQERDILKKAMAYFVERPK